jgi:putative phosphoesterase
VRIAILSDIHGTIVALEAALKHLAQHGNADCIIITGDMFVFGPAPAEVLAALQQLPNVCFLRGNTDRYLWEKTYAASAGSNNWQDQLLFSFCWTAERLGDEGQRFIEALASFQVIKEGDRRLLAVHGSPRSDEEGLTSATTAKDLQEMSLDPAIVAIVGGHTHIPLNRIINEVLVVNAGSVGLPFDGIPQACYAVISNLAARGNKPPQVELARVAYDVEKVVKQLYAVQIPGADTGAYNLRTGRSIGSGLIYTPEMRQSQRKAQTALTPADPKGLQDL